MNANDIIKKYLDSDKSKELLEELKKNKIYFANVENLDIRYSKLKDDMTAKNKLYDEAQKHIEELNNGLKSGEELKAKQLEYEKRIAELEAENQNIKIDSALRQKLFEANATDTDYIIYKIKNRLKSENKTLEIENGNIKDLNNIIETEKKTSPNFFKSETMSKEVEIQNVGKGGKAEAEPKNLIEALKLRNKSNTEE